MAETTLDTIQQHPYRVMDQADAMVRPQAAPAAPVVPAAPPPIQRGTTNPESRLPDTEGVFHKIVRRFKGEGPQ